MVCDMFSLHSSNMGKRVTVLSHLSVKRFQDQFDEVKATPYFPLLMGIAREIDPSHLHVVSMLRESQQVSGTGFVEPVASRELLADVSLT